MKILDVVKPGVVTGEDVQKLFALCKKNHFALPAVNVIGTSSVSSDHSVFKWWRSILCRKRS
jgi:fructose-bisphosphate aldolase class II